MALWYEALEIADGQGKGLGRWRYTYRSDESMPRFPMPLCRCQDGHVTPESARLCPEVQRGLPIELRQCEDDPQDVNWRD